MSATMTNESTSSRDDAELQTSHNSMTRALPPSHILQDGRFIYLPPLSDAERARFLERSIAKHGLLNQDLTQQQKEKKEEVKQEEEKEKEDSSAVKIHPLAVASARLHANGISELSKAINLSGLVSAGDYFGLSNIVDPSLELTADTDKEQGAPSKTVPTTPDAIDARLRAEYIGKRKRDQFVAATEFVEQQSQRLSNAMTAQAVMDERLLNLRKKWRLVAPEHGTRARPHAVRPTEVVAMDVHVYDRDRTGGGNQALLNSTNDMQGRIARRVPRYATVELKDTYNVSQHAGAWKQRAEQYTKENKEEEEEEADVEEEKKEQADVTMTEATTTKTSKDEPSSSCQTRCEPFAVADPTLGKLDVDFDPDKVPMLTLELTIEKASTGFHQSACLSSISGNSTTEDEDIVVALQHSLFCASLFETIRKELLEEQHVWLSSDAEETFLPPPSQMAGSIYNGDVASLCVVHCHEGEVKVQLDSEYVLTVKLVEAAGNGTNMDTDSSKRSGSQSPAQLQVLCRALLLHIQDVYHTHCVKKRSRSLKEGKESEAPGLARIKKRSTVPSPHILQNCVSLGAKMLFESKVRRALKRVMEWLKRQTDEALVVTWLPLSVFDLRSQFALNFREFLVDVSIDRDGMTVTSCGPEVGYKSVDFNSGVEFELFLKHEIRKLLRA